MAMSRGGTARLSDTMLRGTKSSGRAGHGDARASPSLTPATAWTGGLSHTLVQATAGSQPSPAVTASSSCLSSLSPVQTAEGCKQRAPSICGEDCITSHS